jgi:acetate kinase
MSPRTPADNSSDDNRIPDLSAVLVVNAGSSSLKLRLLPGSWSTLIDGPQHGMAAALRQGLGQLTARQLASISAVGHRVVHGGERYTSPVLLDSHVISELERLVPLAPLHNPVNIEAITAAMELLPDLPHVAVFDTAFHASLPPKAFLTGLPRSYYDEHGIRTYGFHGTSHDSVTRRAGELLGTTRNELRIISLHLGNGASAAAVRYGHSIDTTMGFTPIAGLLMGTRTGDLDPGILLHLLRQGNDVGQLERLLQRESGLLGLSGVSHDLRDIHHAARQGDENASQALEAYAYRIRKVIGAYAAALEGVDCVVFTGGAGENDAAVRQQALSGFGWLGLKLDEAANAAGNTRISSADSAVAVLVLPADEEGLIAAQTRELLDTAGFPAGTDLWFDDMKETH